MRQTLLILAASMLVAAGIANGQPAGANDDDEPTAEIGGIVVSAKTGEPLAGAAVGVDRRGSQARGGGRGGNRHATTGPEGRFHFTGLPAGEYSLAVDKTGYERRGRLSTSATLRLAEGEARDDVRIALRPSAVITGRVLDAYGDPLRGAQVRAYRRSYHPDRDRWRSERSATSNDLGEYRIYGLAPGKYALRARPPHETAPSGILYYESAREFYPGVPEADQAGLIRVNWGGEIGAVDFELGAAPKTSLSGVVLDDKTGKPCRCLLRVYGEDRQSRGETTAGPNGRFSLRGLAPGPYYVWATFPGEQRNARQAVRVTDSPADEVVLITSDGATVSGEVIFDDARDDSSENQSPTPGGRSPGQRSRPLQVILTGLIADPSSRRTSIRAPRASGLFEIERLLPGSYRVSLRNLPAGAYLRGVTLGGRRIAGPEITVPVDGSISGLELDVAFDSATVSGTVKPPGGMAADEISTGYVVVISDKTDGYQYRGFRYFDSDASVTFTGMAPGAYTLYAVPEPDTFDLWDPEIQRTLRASGKRLRLSAGDQVSVELPFIPEPTEPM